MLAALRAGYVDDAEYSHRSPTWCITEPSMERLIRFKMFLNKGVRTMIQQSAQLNLSNIDMTLQDPTQWLKTFVTNATANLYTGTDCNYLKNYDSPYLASYALDALTPADNTAVCSSHGHSVFLCFQGFNSRILFLPYFGQQQG
jgi:hypothetical protein